MADYKEIDACRICGSSRLIPILELGCQALTGVFPKSREEKITAGPIELVKCDESGGADACGLVQLRQSYSKAEMYGSNYGYHSSLNRSMVEHLEDVVRRLTADIKPERGDIVLDIGSNDATLLKAYPHGAGLELTGIDPTGEKFRKYYPPHIRLIADFFTRESFAAAFPERQAKIVTSIAMFYDLDSPIDFMREVRSILHPEGVWVMEQSYLPAMLDATAYDTICHEHLEYYGLRQIRWMAERSGLKILDVETNDINGGSFAVRLARQDSARPENSPAIEKLLRQEEALAEMRPYEAFRERVLRQRESLVEFLRQAKAEGKRVLGYGASTKGNVILQYCGLTEADIPCIGEVNTEKFGCFTPGTRIPIVDEKQARADQPDYLLVLPWHFKSFFLKKETDFLRAGGKLVFPLPQIEIH
ncbi:MAG: class I SAM-dependent methyltransferase [Elusimicrobiota bacterium]